MIRFTSDLYLGSSDGGCEDTSIRGCLGEREQFFIDLWNSNVSESDLVFVLGNFITREDPEYFRFVCKRMNGLKFLIYGDSDQWLKDFPDVVQECLFGAYDIYEMLIGPIAMTLTHYPLTQWNKSGFGSVSLHGHVQDESKRFMIDADYKPRLNRFCVSAGMWNGKPVTMYDIITRWPERFFPGDVSEMLKSRRLPEYNWSAVFEGCNLNPNTVPKYSTLVELNGESSSPFKFWMRRPPELTGTEFDFEENYLDESELDLKHQLVRLSNLAGELLDIRDLSLHRCLPGGDNSIEFKDTSYDLIRPKSNCDLRGSTDSKIVSEDSVESTESSDKVDLEDSAPAGADVDSAVCLTDMYTSVF